MSLSRTNTYTKLLNFIWDVNPKSILDVGVGFGGLGTLFRQITDIRFGRISQWQTVIHGIEIETRYNNPLHSYIYNYMYWGDALDMLKQIPDTYDIVFIGDTLEHFEKDDAKEVLELAIKRANKYVVITTPAEFHDNKEEVERFGNRAEEHRCLIDSKILPKNAQITECDGQKLIIIPKNGE